jgi:hypothetical protein
VRGYERPGERTEIEPLDGQGLLHGSWRRSGEGLSIELKPDADTGASWTLTCESATPYGHRRPLLACRFVGASWPVNAGFEVEGVVYLDRGKGVTLTQIERGFGGVPEVVVSE